MGVDLLAPLLRAGPVSDRPVKTLQRGVDQPQGRPCSVLALDAGLRGRHAALPSATAS